MAQNLVTTSAKLIVIGGSSGSLEALMNIFSLLDANFDIPLIIVLHRNNNANTSLTQLLTVKTNLTVKEADEKESINPGYVYLAPPDYHLLIEQDGSFSLDDSEKINYSRPSIDVTFQSAASIYKEGLVAILLSGANADGAGGLTYVKKMGGIAIIQDPDEALFSYMPLQAIAQTTPDAILPATAIAACLNQLNK